MWWSKETVAVVTGANKGIGFALVKKLAGLGLTVILTARDSGKGMAAVESLRAQGLPNDLVQFFPLDVSDPSSIEEFAAWLRETYKGLDILVNNAGVSFNEIGTNSVEYAETVIRTNFYGPKRLTEALLPLFRRRRRSPVSSSRILNISSQLGLLKRLRNPALREVLRDEERLCMEAVEQMVSRFLADVESGSWPEGGWPAVWTDYSVSKLALNVYSRLLAKQEEGRGLSVNCFCPGFTMTSMTGGRGRRTADEAADLAAKLVLLPASELPTGKFFKWDVPSLHSNL